MSNKGKRKAFGPNKKRACDVHHCMKKKQQTHAHKDLLEDIQIKHPRAQF